MVLSSMSSFVHHMSHVVPMFHYVSLCFIVSLCFYSIRAGIQKLYAYWSSKGASRHSSKCRESIHMRRTPPIHREALDMLSSFHVRCCKAQKLWKKHGVSPNAMSLLSKELPAQLSGQGNKSSTCHLVSKELSSTTVLRQMWTQFSVFRKRHVSTND